MCVVTDKKIISNILKKLFAKVEKLKLLNNSIKKTLKLLTLEERGTCETILARLVVKDRPGAPKLGRGLDIETNRQENLLKYEKYN